MRIEEEIVVGTLAERLKIARERLGLSQQQLAEEVGVSQQAIGKIEGGVTLQPRNLKTIAEKLSVSANWLQFGELDSNGQKTTFVIKEWEETQQDHAIFTEIPILDVELAAGNGCMAEIVENEESTFPFRKDDLRSSGVLADNARIVKINGSSLYPVLKNGDLVAVDLSKKNPVRDGDLYAVRDGVLLRVKVLINRPDGGVILRSFNKEEYPDEVLTLNETFERITVIGRVFWSSRRW